MKDDFFLENEFKSQILISSDRGRSRSRGMGKNNECSDRINSKEDSNTKERPDQKISLFRGSNTKTSYLSDI